MAGNFTEIMNYRDGTNLIAGVLILMIGIFGVFCNSIFLIYFVSSSERTSFNIICFFRALVNLYILTTAFLLLFLPTTILGTSPFQLSTESWIINLVNSLYLGNEYQIVLVALNRFCALFFPRYYPQIFATKPTILVCVLFYGYRLTVVIYMTAADNARGCFYFFSSQTLTWMYPPDETCLYVDNIVYIILATFVSMTCINLITLSKIVKFYGSISLHDLESQKRIRKNAIMFFQTIIQDSLYIIDLSFTFKLSSLSTARWWTFLSGTMIWECLHSVDGFIMLLFTSRVNRGAAVQDNQTSSSVAAQRRTPIVL